MMIKSQMNTPLWIYSSYLQQNYQVSVYKNDLICGIQYNINLSQESKSKWK